MNDNRKEKDLSSRINANKTVTGKFYSKTKIKLSIFLFCNYFVTIKIACCSIHRSLMDL